MTGDKAMNELVARSAAMRAVLRQIELVRDSSAAVLVTGERGTGKELVARVIHQSGARAREPFVEVSCGSAPEEVLERVLFGGEEQGRFEQAGKGTLYLSDVGSLPTPLQARVVRALTEGVVERTGVRRLFPFRARVIVSSHEDLRQRVREGSFREDFFRRVNLFPIPVPTLNQRREDIPGLAQMFVERHGTRRDPPVHAIESRALLALQAQDWPGNASELEVVVINALDACGPDGVLRSSQLPAPIRALAPAAVESPPAPEPRPEPVVVGVEGEIVPLDELERRAILHALRVTGGNVTRAARALGIGRATMYRKLERFRIATAS